MKSMNRSKTFIGLVAAGLMALLLPSCASLGGISNTNKGIKSTERPRKRSHRDVLPEDRQQFIIDRAAKQYTPEDLRRGIIKGAWAIEEVGGRPVAGMEAPYITFDVAGKKFYGNNGCNYLNGDYTYSPEHKTIRFSNTISTMRECETAVVTERAINEALENVRSYNWELRDTQFYLFFNDSAGKCLLTLMHQDFDFMNGTWLVKAIDNEPVNIPDLRFVIDVAENKIHGNTGCNVLNGKLLTEMDAPNSISFQAIDISDNTCPDVEYENELIVALEDAATARPISPTKMLLLNNHGIVVLELERVTPKSAPTTKGKSKRR